MRDAGLAKARELYKKMIFWGYESPVTECLAEGIYNSLGFGFGNVGTVITGEGVAVIDTTSSVTGAAEILANIRKLTDGPVKYLIYTHGHGDHVRGAEVFKKEGAVVIAHENVPKRFDRYKMLFKQYKHINERQFRLDSPDLRSGLKSNGLSEDGMDFVYPDITFSHEYKFRLGGKTLKLVHGKGETDDHSMVYILEDKVCFTGDFIVWAFPNVGNPAKVQRYARDWYQALEKIMGFGPEAVGPGHGPAIKGRDEVQRCLQDTAGALKYLHDEVVKGINAGESLDSMLQTIRLPQHLAESPYLRPIYGTPEFTIRGIHREYCGWYDGNPTNLRPLPQKVVNHYIFELIKDVESVYERVEQLRGEGKYQDALHLIDLIVIEQPENKKARLVKAELLEEVAKNYEENIFYLNFYYGGSQKIREEVGLG